MDMNRMTQKSQEAVQAAQALATRYGHVEVDGEHLLLALFEQAEGLVERLVRRLDIDPKIMTETLRSEIQKLPRFPVPALSPARFMSPSVSINCW